MTMKKIFTAIVALALSVPSFAQYSSGGFSLDGENVYFGIRIGMTAASLSGEDVTVDGRSYSTDLGAKAGMTLAGVVGLRVSNNTPLFLESGVYYTERGGKKDKFQVSYNNLEFPILIKYGIKATDDIALLPFVGPYFSYAIGGKTKQLFDQSGNPVEKVQKVGTFDEKKAYTGGLKRANMGFKLGCGVEYNKLYLELGYQFGVTNISKLDDMSTRSNAFFANFGVNF